MEEYNITQYIAHKDEQRKALEARAELLTQPPSAVRDAMYQTATLVALQMENGALEWLRKSLQPETSLLIAGTVNTNLN